MKTFLQTSVLQASKSQGHILVAMLVLTFVLGTVNANAQCFTPLSFTNTSYSTVGAQQGAVGDVNGDGKPDLIVPSGNALYVLLNNGTGGFGVATNTNVTGISGGGDVAGWVADFNGDGKADVAVVDQGAGNVKIYQGNGDGTFVAAPIATLTVGTTPTAIFAGDFNNDGKTDIAVSNYSSTSVSVYLNTGTFVTPFAYSFSTLATLNTVGGDPRFVMGADLNGDGKIDLISANDVGGANGVAVFINNGTGGYGAATNYTAGTNPYGIAVGDFNSDGKIDLAIANKGGTDLSILLNNGTGGFGAATSLPLGASTNPYSVVAADFNNDGKMDLATANHGTNTVSVLFGNGAGGFTTAFTPLSVNSGPYSVYLGDFNSDGRMDFASWGGSVNVLLNTTSTASASAGGACVGGSLTLTGGPSTGGTTYAWSGPGGFTSSLQSPVVPSALAGTYSITVTQSGPCTASASVAVTLSAAPTATASSPSTACSIGSLALTGGPSGMTTYSWSGPNTFTSSAQNASVFHPGISAVGTYTLTVANSSGCSGSATTTVSSVTTGTTTANSYNLCAGQSVTPHSKTYTTTGTYVDATGSCSTDTSKVKVFFGTGGSASFGTVNTISTANIQLAAIGDINGDGKPDLVIPSGGIYVLLNNGSGGFTGPTNTGVTGSNSPEHATIADFDGDGKADVAISNEGGVGTVTVYKGNGIGGFTATPTATLTVGNTPTAVTSIDFNGDGKMDLASSNYGSASVSVALGNGDGTFGAVTNYTVGTNPRFIISADINGDGKLDLITANQGTSNISILLGNGNGTFQAKTDFAAGSACYGVAIGDFNNDGKPDVAVANSTSTNISVLLNTGSWSPSFTLSFATAVNYALPTSANTQSIVAGDFNGDGIIDLATANHGTNNITIFQGSGTGTFTTTANLTSTSTVYSIGTADLNADGKPDLVTFNSASVSVLLNITGIPTATTNSPVCAGGTLTLTGAPSGGTYSWAGPNSYTSATQSPNISSVTSAAAGIYTLTVTGANSCTTTATTAAVSLVVASASATTPVCTNGTLSLTGNPSGLTSYSWKGPNSFTSSVQSPNLVSPTTAAAGIYTLTVVSAGGCTLTTTTASVTVNQGSPASNQSLSICGGQSILVGSTSHNGTGTYTDRIVGGGYNGCDSIVTTKLKVYFGSGGAASFNSSNVSISGSTQLANAADINGDGKPDLIIPSGGLFVSINNGSGGFSTATNTNVTGTNGDVAAAIADFNGDGKMDVAVVNQTGNSITIYQGNGDGTFVAAPVVTISSIGSTPTSAFAGDFNGDGKPDLAISNYGNHTVSIVLNTGGFSSPFSFSFSGITSVTATGVTNSRFITGADINNDGSIDLAMANETGGVAVLQGNGTGTFTNVAGSPFTAGTTGYGVAIADYNADGKLDLAVVNRGGPNVSILINNGVGTAFGFATAVNYTVGSNPQSIVTADFNGDGIPDLATANSGATSVSVLQGNGTGGFSTTSTPSLGAAPYSLATADFNGDGKPDIATFSSSSSSSILLNSTSSVFTGAIATATTPVCPNGTLILTGSPAALSGYSWKGPNSYTSSIQSPSITSVTTAAAGIYTLTVVVDAGCTATATSASVVINSLVATASATTPACTNSTLTLTGGPAAMTSYLWTGPNSYSSTLQSPVLSNPTTAAAGVYTLKVTAASGCTSTASTASVTIKTGPAVTSLSPAICVGQSVTVGSHTYTLTGTYSDKLAAINGCDSIVKTKLTVYFGNGGNAAFPVSPLVLNASARPQLGAAADVNSDGKIDLIVPDANGLTMNVLLGNGSGGFGAANNFTVGNNPVSVTIADFTGDGVMDMAVANQGSTTATVYKGNNNGTFVSAALSTLTVGSTPTSITSADFNGDGIMDLAVACYGSNSVYLFLGTGAGAFTAAPTPTVAVGSNPRFVISADINGDGFVDLIVANQTGGVTVLKGDGTGSFTAASVSPLSAGTTCYGIAIGDYNGDGKPDIAVANDGSSNVSLFINNGSGSPSFTFAFTIPVGSPYATGSAPQSIVTADFNGDGILDLATSNYSGSSSATISVLLGTGTGTFGTATSYPGTTSPYCIGTADFNGDGESDIVTYNNITSSSATVFINATSGITATASATTPVCSSGTNNSTLNLTGPAGGTTYFWSGPNSYTSSLQNPVISSPSTLAAGVYSLTVTSSHGCTSGASTASVVVNAPTPLFTQTITACSSFTVGSTVHTTSGTYTDMTTNVNGCDAPVTTYLTINQPSFFTQTLTICAGQNIHVGSKIRSTTGTYVDRLSGAAANNCDSTVTTKLTVFFNTGAASFTTASPATVAVGTGPQSVITADFNGDGIADFATSNISTSNASVFLGNGSGGFTSVSGSPFSVGSSPYAVAAGDYNGDGKTDLATFSYGSVSILLGNGTGGFAAAVNTTAGSGMQLGAAGDLNGDGKSDLVLPNGAGTTITVLISNGGGNFSTNQVSYAVGSNPVSTAIADYNGDGKLDLAVANQGSASVSVLLGNGDGSFATALVPTNTVGSTPTSVISGDFDNDGKLDLAVSNYSSNTVSVLKGNGDGTFQAKVDYAVGTSPRFVTAAYLNGDGIIDLAAANQGGNVSVLVGNGNGTFQTPATSVAAGSAPYGIAVADYNGDGKADMAVANSSSNNVSILLNSTVTALPTVVATASPNSICLNDNTTISASGASTYTWAPALSLSLTTGTSVTANPSATTTYTLTGTDVHGCVNSGNAVVTIKSLPSVSVNPASAVCTGNTNAVLTASGASTYNWAPTANLTSTDGGITQTAQISQLTFYTVTGTGANSCTANVIVPVATVATGGVISPAFSIICSGTTKTLTVTGAAGHDYQWQISTNNTIWTNISGATNTTYTTTTGDGTTNKFYRLMAQSNSCWNVASTTAEVDISNPVIAVTATNITDNSFTLSWSPTGTGNYAISYSGTSSATQTSVTPDKTITGLTANGTYSITVTQTGVAGCSASGTLTGVNTLCAMPTGVTLSSPANAQILVSWTGVGGANYRVYYRPLFAFGYFFTKDVSGVSSALITKQGANNLYGSTTYEVYVSRLDCPTTGTVGQGTNPTNVTTLPTVSCPTPVIDSVRSLCPVQIEVFMHPGSSPTNTYNVYLQRITPTVLAVNSYGVSGNYFTINVPYSGDVYLIAVDSKCTGGALSRLYVYPGNVTVKPLCTSPANLVLSNPTCNGFTASWNGDQCLSNTASGYNFYMRQAGTINYNSYGVAPTANGIGPNKKVNWLASGRNFQVFVRSVYSCNGFITYGPSSLTQTITTLSGGCRDEDTQQPEETKPAVQQYSPDNQEVFSLYPNPNTGEFAVDLSRYSTEEDAVRIEVINMIGQTVMTHLTTISGGHMSEYINLPNGTAAGTYIVRLTAGKNVYTTKINVSK